jgi:hypothetical protein
MKTCARISHLAVMLSVVSFCSAQWLPFDSSGRFVFHPPAAKQIFDQCSRSAPPANSSLWEPSSKELDDLETLLATYLNQRETAGKAVPPKRTKYHRQYVGFVRNGERFIYGNFYPAVGEFSSYEAHRAVAVCDGGHVFWGIIFDVGRRTFEEPRFNGSLGIPPPPPKS